MASLLDQVTKILSDRFADFDHHLEKVPGTDRITGFIISSSFRGKDDDKRQKTLWRELQANLSDTDMLRIGAIVAMTPEEAAVHDS